MLSYLLGLRQDSIQKKIIQSKIMEDPFYYSIFPLKFVFEASKKTPGRETTPTSLDLLSICPQ